MMENQKMPFLEKCLSEARDLLVESQAFLMQVEGGSVSIPADSQIVFQAASMRLAAREAEMLAWLLAQKAAAEGEMSQAQALSPAFALSHLPICLEATDEDSESLPLPFRHMLRQSRLLYERVVRLDEQMQGKDKVVSDN